MKPMFFLLIMNIAINLVNCQDSFTDAMNKGNTAIQKKDFKQAVEYYEQALKESQTIKVRNKQANKALIQGLTQWYQSAINQKSWIQATIPLNKLLEQQPRNFEPYCHLSQVYYKLKMLDKARVSVSRCWANLDKNKEQQELMNIITHVQNGLMRLELLKDGSLESLLELIRSYPDSSEAQEAREKLPHIIATLLRDPGKLGPPTYENPDSFEQYYQLLINEYADHPVTKELQKEYKQLHRAYKDTFRMHIAAIKQTQALVSSRTFCNEANMLFIELERRTHDISVTIDSLLHDLHLYKYELTKRRIESNKVKQNSLFRHKEIVNNLVKQAQLLRPVSPQHQWIAKRLKLLANAVTNLYNLTDEYLSTLDEHARIQRYNNKNWATNLSLQIQREIRWICPKKL